MILYIKSFLLILPIFSWVLLGDVSRFLTPLDISPKGDSSVIYKSSAFVSPFPSGQKENEKLQQKKLIVDRVILEKYLSEALAYRYQASGDVVAYVTREWKPMELSSNFLLKIKDCVPDELVVSSFVRFDLWDQGLLVGEFAVPIRMSHMVDVYFTSSPILRGHRLDPSFLTSRKVDVLKQFAGSVPTSSKLSSYQSNANLRSGSSLKWNQLSKVALVRKGKIVDVFASGKGIYVTMKGMAMDDGVEGGIVRIKNISSDKEFQAKVLNENSVKVHL